MFGSLLCGRHEVEQTIKQRALKPTYGTTTMTKNVVTKDGQHLWGVAHWNPDQAYDEGYKRGHEGRTTAQPPPFFDDDAQAEWVMGVEDGYGDLLDERQNL